MSFDTEEDLSPQDELASLKERATLLGIKFHPSISLEKLRDKVNAVMSDEAPEARDEVSQASSQGAESETAKRVRLRREATALVRVRVTCMNPAKKEWEGEIFTVGNGVVGTHRKYIPFNADEGWHVPQIILNQILERQCQVFVTTRDERGNRTRQGKLIKEFAVEILDPLTPEELTDLAQRQAMSKAIV